MQHSTQFIPTAPATHSEHNQHQLYHHQYPEMQHHFQWPAAVTNNCQQHSQQSHHSHQNQTTAYSQQAPSQHQQQQHASNYYESIDNFGNYHHQSYDISQQRSYQQQQQQQPLQQWQQYAQSPQHQQRATNQPASDAAAVNFALFYHQHQSGSNINSFQSDSAAQMLVTGLEHQNQNSLVDMQQQAMARSQVSPMATTRVPRRRTNLTKLGASKSTLALRASAQHNASRPGRQTSSPSTAAGKNLATNGVANSQPARPSNTTTTTTSSRSQRRHAGRASCDCPNCLEIERARRLRIANGGEAEDPTTQDNGPNGAAKLMHVCHHAGCGKEYGKTSHLRAHLRWHTTERVSTCRHSDCGMQFSRTDELRRHMRTHHSQQTITTTTKAPS